MSVWARQVPDRMNCSRSSRQGRRTVGPHDTVRGPGAWRDRSACHQEMFLRYADRTPMYAPLNSTIHAPSRLGIERVSEFTASIGIAICPTHGTTLDEIIQAADNACYDAKHAGRNRVTARHADLNSPTPSLLPKPGTD